jgi:hypothetical protein
VRLRELELELPGLPPELDGLRIAHLSDFHLGVPSPGVGAVWQAPSGGAKPDLVATSGDPHPSAGELMSGGPSGSRCSGAGGARNHDIALSHDPRRLSDLRQSSSGRRSRRRGLLELHRRCGSRRADPRLIVRAGDASTRTAS